MLRGQGRKRCKHISVAPTRRPSQSAAGCHWWHSASAPSAARSRFFSTSAGRGSTTGIGRACPPRRNILTCKALRRRTRTGRTPPSPLFSAPRHPAPGRRPAVAKRNCLPAKDFCLPQPLDTPRLVGSIRRLFASSQLISEQRLSLLLPIFSRFRLFRSNNRPNSPRSLVAFMPSRLNPSRAASLTAP